MRVIACAAGCGTGSTPNQSASNIASPTTSAHGPAGYGPQSVLPFTDLNGPHDVAVDNVGNVYATDMHIGNEFPADTDRVLMLAAGSNTQTVLRYTGFDGEPLGVDSAGNMYCIRGGGVVAGGGCCKPVEVLKLAAGSSTSSVLPFTGDVFSDVVVDNAGSVYVVESTNRVLKLAPGASAPTPLPFPDLKNAAGLAVDSAGNVNVTDFERNRVLKLAAGASGPTVLPFSGLNHPAGVAVDAAGSVYVADSGNRRVVKLPTQ